VERDLPPGTGRRSAGDLISLLALADASVSTGCFSFSRAFHPASSPHSPILDHEDRVALSSQLGTKVALASNEVRADPEAFNPGDYLSDTAFFYRMPRTQPQGSLTHKHLQGQLRLVLRGGSDAEEPDEEPAWGA
jgi:hypothetical protein